MARFSFLCVIALLVVCVSHLSEAALMLFDNDVGNNLTRWPADQQVTNNDYTAGNSATGVRPSWRNARVKIAYEISTRFSRSDQLKITTALEKIEDVTRNCIQFVPYSGGPTSQPWDSHPVRIVPEPAAVVCTTFNGKNTVSDGQYMFMFSSTTKKGECLTEPRDTVRQFMNLLGIGNEYQRDDRRSFLQVHPDPVSLKHDTLTGGSGNFVLGENAHISTADDFDVNSVTMVNGDRFTQEGKIAFARRDNGSLIFSSNPAVVKLSEFDCENLNFLYKCRLDCDNGSEFAPYEEVGLSRGLKPDKLSTNLNCWDATDLEGEIPASLGFLGNVQPVEDAIVPNKLRWETTPVADAKFKVTGPASDSASRNTAVSLRRKLGAGLFGPDNKVVVTAKNGTVGNEKTYINQEVGIELNCLPKFTVNENAVQCAADQVAGTSATECTTTTPINTIPQPCQGSTVDRLWLGPFVVTDPDIEIVDFAPQFRSVSVFIGGAELPAFMWTWQQVPHPNALIGYVVKTDPTPLDVSSLVTVRLSVVDLSSAMYGINIPRPVPQDVVQGIPVVKTLTATFKVDCQASGSPYPSFLGGVSQLRL